MQDLGSQSEAEEASAAGSEAGAAPAKGTRRKWSGVPVESLVSARGKGRGRGGAKLKAKTGVKMCAPCGKTHPIEEFPPGKAMCGKAFNAMRNVGKAAASQGQTEWWDKVTRDPGQLKAVCSAYMIRVSPEVTGQRCKKGGFCIAQYKDDVADCMSAQRGWG